MPKPPTILVSPPAMRAMDANRIFFDRAADRMDLSTNMRSLLLMPKREVSVQIAVELDNGEIGTYVGYRVQHDDARGPMKGGLRLSSRSRSGRSSARWPR